MRRSTGRAASRAADGRREAVRTHNLRYRIEIEMLPRSGVLRVADEYLAPLTSRGEPSRRNPFLERRGDRLLQRREGGTHVTHHDRFLDHSILSMPHYPPHHPHLVAARHELESWLFLCFEPRERMRAADPLKEGRRIGADGRRPGGVPQHREGRGAAALRLRRGRADRDDAEVRRHPDRGERARRGRAPAHGTRRGDAGAPAVGRHAAPARTRGADRLRRAPGPRRHRGARNRRASAPDPDDRGDAGNPGRASTTVCTRRHVVTTRDPFLPDLVPNRSLFVVQRTEATNDETRIVPFSTWRASRRRRNARAERRDDREYTRIWERIVRGDFDPEA